MGGVRFDIRRKFCTQRMVTHWNRLAKEVVNVPSLEAFKARLDVALGSLVWWLATLHIAGGLTLHDHRGPFQSRPFYDSTISLRCESNIWHMRTDTQRDTSVSMLYKCPNTDMKMGAHNSMSSKASQQRNPTLYSLRNFS